MIFFLSPWESSQLGNRFEDPADVRTAVWDCVPRPWNDWSPGAAWIETIWSSHDAWVAGHGGAHAIHPLFGLMGVTFASLVTDSLHVMEIGVTHRVLGNLLYHLVFNACFFPAATPAGRLDTLWELIVVGYAALRSPCQLSRLTLSMFSNPAAPRSKQPQLSSTCKAAESRNLVAVLLCIFRGLCRRGNTEDSHILAVMESLNTYYQILSRHKTALTIPVVDQRTLERALWTLNRRYSALEAWAIGLGLLRWGTTIKFHMALHIAFQSKFTNPSLTWTYMDEDFMSIVKAVGESCAEATPAHKIFPKLCQRYLVGMGVRIGFAIDLQAMD